MRAVLIATVLAIGVLLPSTADAAIQWSECGTTFKGECATIDAPIDWAHPDGAKFPLAIGRVRALDPAHRIGVLLANPGGPGNSGINAFITGRAIPDDSPLRQYFDIVSWDPRGVSRSHAVTCSADLVAQTPGTFPATSGEYRSLLSFNARLAADCRRQTGPLFDHVDTISTVRDMDAIRAALGETKLSYFGTSYGTQIGQQYAELFPGRIRAMALDSSMDHSIVDAYEYLRSTTDDLEGAFNEFAAWCGRTVDCALHDQNVGAVWDDLFKRAKVGDLHDPETGELISAETLRLNLFLAMFRTVGWFTLADQLKQLAESPSKVAARAAAAETVENPYPAIWCSDWRWRIANGFPELDNDRKRLEAAYPHTQMSPFWSDVTGCLGWPGVANNPQHRLHISGTPKILLVKAHEDVGTPKSWNYAAAAQIPNSVLLEYDGIGHVSFRNSPCARAYIEDYLTKLVTPAPGTHCPAVFPTAPTSALTAPADVGPPVGLHAGD
jgi:pimeloyl-ACP methyl ester carboxylesterase